MRSFLAGALATAAIALTFESASAAVLLNEVLVNPPGADDAREYVEISASPGDSLAGVWLLEIEGDTTGPGVVEHALDLSSASLGANGILLIGHNYATSVPWTAVPAATARLSLMRKPSAMIENGSVTFLLVHGFTAAVGADLDTNDDGALDASPWDALLDGVAWIDGASGRAYSPAVIAIAGGVLDGATRLPGNATSSSASAWYGADVLASGGTPDLSTAYDAAHASPNFPVPPIYVATGALTPGAPNVPALVVVAVCGDGVVQAGEQCDDHNLSDGDCCSSTCALEPFGTICRPTAGACDRFETCDGASGACPADAMLPAGTECRAAAGACDVSEACDGASAACPDDATLPAGTECRAAAGSCDISEACDGSSAACPDDATLPAGTECRVAAGSCDASEVCDGASARCPDDAKLPAGTACRAAVGSCDAVEACDGASAACPADAALPDGGACDDGDACTADDRCTAGSCAGDRDPACELPPSFTCHKVAPAKAPRGAPAFPSFAPRSGDVVVDGVASSLPSNRNQLDLQRAAATCGPDGLLTAGRAHLAAYQVKLTKTDPRQPKPAKSVHTIANAAGRLRVRIDGVARVLAPAAVALGTASPEPIAGGTLDHFKCYRVSVAREPGNDFESTTFALDDPLAGHRVVELLGPSHLCAPASFNGVDDGAAQHAGHLLCYKARLAKLDPAQPKDVKTRVAVATAFGDEVVDATALSELCLPSLRLD